MLRPLRASEAGFVTFGAFNNLAKTSDTILTCWAQILLELPASRLRLNRARSAQRAAEVVALFGASGRGPGARRVRAPCRRPAVRATIRGSRHCLGHLPLQRRHDDLRVAVLRRTGHVSVRQQRGLA